MVLTRTTDGKSNNNDKKSKNTESDQEKLLDIIKEAVNQAIQELRIEVSDLKTQVDNLTQTNKELISILTSGKINQFQWNSKNASNVDSSNIDLESTSNSDSGDTIIEATQKSPKSTDKFHTISSKIVYNKYKRQHKSKSHTIVGSAQVHEDLINTGDRTSSTLLPLAAAPKRAWIYAGRFRSETTEEAIQQYINSKCPNADAKVEALKTDNNINNSFKINVLFDFKDALYTDSFWPKGIIIKRFQFRNKYRSAK